MSVAVGKYTFRSTNRNNACAICGDTKGRCRWDDRGGIYCMDIHGGSVPGYVFLTVTNDGLWGIWKTSEDAAVRDDYNPETRQQRSRPLAPIRSLSATERDRHYSRILGELSLAAPDLADLTRRNLSRSEIDAGGFSSVERHQSLRHSYPLDLPGVGYGGRKLLNSAAGYLCPVRDADRRIVAFQYRLREASGGRYRWLSSDASLRLPNGEIPLAVHPGHSKATIGMTEGTGVKPFLAANRLDQTVIGAAGGNFAGSRQTLEHTITTLGTREAIFYPDAGAILNHHVLSQYLACWELLKALGVEVKVGWWDQAYKGRPDIDELSDYSQVTLIAPKNFWMKAKIICNQEYQGLRKSTGRKPINTHRAHPIDIARELKACQKTMEAIALSSQCRTLLVHLGLDWEHPNIKKWRGDRHPDTFTLRQWRELHAKLIAAQNLA